MKLLISSLLLLLSSSAATIVAQEDYIENCQTHFSIQLEVVAYDGIDLERCSSDEFEALEEVVSGVAQIDWIAAQLGTPLSEFMVAYETFGQGAIFAAPTHGKPPPLEDTLPDSEEELLFDLEVNGCGPDDPDCIELDEPVVRKLRERLTQPNLTKVEHYEHPEPASNLDWTLRQVNFTFHRELTQHRRLYDCGTTNWCQGADWCCRFCPMFNHCRRRRQRRRLAESEPQCVTVRTAGEDNISEKEKMKIMKFEKRVSKRMTRELRRVARLGQREKPEARYLCLGNHKKLYARMDRHFFEEICEGDPNYDEAKKEAEETEAEQNGTA